LSRDGVVLALGHHRGPRAATEPEAVRPVERTLLRMTLVGGNPASSAAGIEELPGKVNYFIGKDPKTWRTNVPTYGKVRYGAVYRESTSSTTATVASSSTTSSSHRESTRASSRWPSRAPTRSR
jgi:hypothetical protein